MHFLRCFFKRIVSFSLALSFICSLCSCKKINNDFDGTRFASTHHISVSVESVIGLSTDTSSNISAIANFIRENVLKDCNIDITFIDSSSTSIYERISPDISFSYDPDQITTYYKMNSVINLAPYFDEYSNQITYLTEFLSESDNYSKKSDSTEVWYLIVTDNNPETKVTFIRKDWLDLLGLKAPTDIDELHACLVAFKNNAQMLLGDNDNNMIPFLIDNNPSVSAKPLFDSQFDTSISDKDFYINGYNRATQDGYKDGLRILNNWYVEGLLPMRFFEIRPLTKESYEPIEKGYVGAFCSRYDYLYINGDNALVNSLKKNCGEKAEYIAVNCFSNNKGAYTYWQEDYLDQQKKHIYFPSTCKDPLACLVYLNWLSDPANIKKMIDFLPENADKNLILDRYLLKPNGSGKEFDKCVLPSVNMALNTAKDVKIIKRRAKCVKYSSKQLKYVNSTVDYVSIYPKSTGEFACNSIKAPSGAFEASYKDFYEDYLNSGAYFIRSFRENEWKKVYEEHNMRPW